MIMKSIHKRQTDSSIQDVKQMEETSGKGHPDPEVSETKHRRRFTAKYKLRILSEVDSCTTPGETGAILRREGLYSSNLTRWKKQKEQGLLEALTPQKRGRKILEKNPLSSKVAQLEKENEKLIKKLQQAEMIIDVQKKLSELLGIPLSQQPEKKE